MPPSHQQYAKWSGERFRHWAAQIGANTAAVVEAILSGHKVEQQGYRSCMALLNLSEKYTPERLEAACTRVLAYTPRPSFSAVQTILKSGGDRIREEPETPRASTPSAFSFTRGADYYGREHK